MPNPNLNTDKNTSTNTTRYVYHPRLTCPESGNPYYNTTDVGGYFTARRGNYNNEQGSLNPKLTVLRNCVGYAYGRFNEIVGQGKMVYLSPDDAGKFMNYAAPCKTGKIPKLGACMVWKDSQGPGHVAIVEKINPDGSIVTSESE